MERLWAPWRMKYIDDLMKGLGDECFLCENAGTKGDDERYILARSGNSFVILNKYPYNCGHLMIVPMRHVSNLSDLTAKERADLMNLVSESIDVLRSEFNPDGFNCGFNLGRVAGAGVEDHIHFHIVPRWSGDANFLAILGDTKSLPEWLDETYAKLKPAFKKVGRGKK